MQENLFTDQQLISYLAAGSDQVFELLFNKYLHKLHLFATAQTNNEELAREIVMDVMLRLWQKREELGQIRSLNAYLYSAVKNAIIDNFRKKAFQFGSLEDLIHEPMFNEQADSQLIDRELQQALQDGVGQLSPQRRVIYKMKREQDLSHKEIAMQLNLSTKTVENHLSAATNFLKNYVKKNTDLALPLALILFLFH